MTCGMIAPAEGQVLLDGVDVTDWPMYKRAQYGMGYLAQESSVFVKLTVEQNIIAILEMLHVKRRERRAITDELLEQFGLTRLRKSVASHLSGGERRRLEIARCLASEPALILLDEPFTGIDPVTIHSIQDIIRELRDSGIAILLTDHRERETLTITDRAYVICAGQVLVSGDAETVLKNEAAQEMYFGKRFDADSIISGKEAMLAEEQANRLEAANKKIDRRRNQPLLKRKPLTKRPRKNRPTRTRTPPENGGNSVAGLSTKPDRRRRIDHRHADQIVDIHPLAGRMRAPASGPCVIAAIPFFCQKQLPSSANGLAPIGNLLPVTFA